MVSLIDIIEPVRSRLGVPDSMAQHFDYLVTQAVPPALRAVAELVAESNDRAQRSLLAAEFTATLSSGRCDLSSLTSISGTLVPRAPFLHASDGDLPGQFVPDRTLLELEPDPLDWFSYTVSGGKVYTNSEGTTLTVTANFIPTALSAVPASLVPALLEHIISLLEGVNYAEDEKVSLLESFPGRAEEAGGKNTGVPAGHTGAHRRG